MLELFSNIWTSPHLQTAYSLPSGSSSDLPSDSVTLTYCNILGGSIHDGTLLHYKTQHTTVKHSQKLFEHTYTSDLYGPGALIPIEFFQQDLLWQSSNTHSHSCSQKACKHTRSIRRRAIGPLALHNGTSAYTSLTRHLPTCSSHNFRYELSLPTSKESAAKYTRPHPTDIQTRLFYPQKFENHSNVRPLLRS
jgi:hypothetical protein